MTDYEKKIEKDEPEWGLTEEIDDLGGIVGACRLI